MGHRLWLPAVAIHRLGIVEIAPSPHRCFRTANPCAQSVNGSPAEPVLSRSSRQRLGHLQSHFDRGWHVCQAVFPELQPAAACRRVERRENVPYTGNCTTLEKCALYNTGEMCLIQEIVLYKAHKLLIFNPCAL